MKLRQMLRESKKSQTELAEIFGVTQPAVSQWTSGSSFPNGEKLFKVAAFFNVDPLALLKSEKAEPDQAA